MTSSRVPLGSGPLIGEATNCTLESPDPLDDEEGEALLDTCSQILTQIGSLIATTVWNGQNVFLCPDPDTDEEACCVARYLNRKLGVRNGRSPVLALSTDPDLFDNVGKHWSPEEVLTQQVNGLAERHDLLIVLSPDTPSEDLRSAVRAARAKHLNCVAVLGPRGEILVRHMDASLMVPETVLHPARVRHRAWEIVARVAVNTIRDRLSR